MTRSTRRLAALGLGAVVVLIVVHGMLEWFGKGLASVGFLFLGATLAYAALRS